MPPFSEEEWLEISSEMPSNNDVFLRRYLAGRDALIGEEKKQRSGMNDSGNPSLSLPVGVCLKAGPLLVAVYSYSNSNSQKEYR